jgi:hypothetical protein
MASVVRVGVVCTIDGPLMTPNAPETSAGSTIRVILPNTSWRSRHDRFAKPNSAIRQSRLADRSWSRLSFRPNHRVRICIVRVRDKLCRRCRPNRSYQHVWRFTGAAQDALKLKSAGRGSARPRVEETERFCAISASSAEIRIAHNIKCLPIATRRIFPIQFKAKGWNGIARCGPVT